MFRQRNLIIVVALNLGLGIAWLSETALAQTVQPVNKSDAVLAVEGVVQGVFSGARQNRTDYVVLIEVRRSELLKPSNTATRFPAAGEIVYVHASQQPPAGLAVKADVSSAVPTERSQVRAYLIPREGGTWSGTFDTAPQGSASSPPALPSGAGGTPDRAGVSSLGMTFEPAKVKDRLVLRVKSVERGGPAQQVGIEVGDVIIGVKGEPLQSAGQLDEMARRGEAIPLIVADVNTNQTSRLELRPRQPSNGTTDADRNAPSAPRRSLGLSAEPVKVGLRTALKVTRVEDGGPAQKAGIEPEDILVAANGAPLTGPEQLGSALRKSGPTLSLTVRDSRTGKDVQVEVAIGGPVIQASLPSNVPPIGAAAGSLGAVTELSFYDVEAAVKVTEVQPDSPAARAGLQPGLVILEADGRPLLHPNDLIDAVRNSSGTVRLTVVDPRTGAKRAVQVSLAR
jgi:serine protease Do